MSDPDVYRRLDALERKLEALSAAALVVPSSGTWTPSFAGTGTAGTFTYTIRTGSYVRLGSHIEAKFDVLISAITVAPTGTMQITGLPLTANGRGAMLFSYIANFNYSAASLGLLGRLSGTIVNLSESFDNAAAVDVPAANFTNANCFLIGRVMYEV